MEFKDYIAEVMDENDCNKNLIDYNEENFGCQSVDDDVRELNFDQKRTQFKASEKIKTLSY